VIRWSGRGYYQGYNRGWDHGKESDRSHDFLNRGRWLSRRSRWLDQNQIGIYYLVARKKALSEIILALSRHITIHDALETTQQNTNVQNTNVLIMPPIITIHSGIQRKFLKNSSRLFHNYWAISMTHHYDSSMNYWRGSKCIFGALKIHFRLWSKWVFQKISNLWIFDDTILSFSKNLKFLNFWWYNIREWSVSSKDKDHWSRSAGWRGHMIARGSYDYHRHVIMITVLASVTWWNCGVIFSEKKTRICF